MTLMLKRKKQKYRDDFFSQHSYLKLRAQQQQQQRVKW